MTEQSYKSPDRCATMQDVRQAIDRLDEQLLELLGQRLEYIRRAAQLKTSIDQIRDEQRIESMIAHLKGQAASHGYSEQLVETVFRELIDFSVAHEMQLWKESNPKQ